MTKAGIGQSAVPLTLNFRGLIEKQLDMLNRSYYGIATWSH
jgi:hypothetical protein